MPQPKPYGVTKSEQEQFIKKVGEFKFNDFGSLGNTVVLIAGPEGSGKTHLACTASERGPLYIVDTEYRAYIVASKFKKAGREIKVGVVRNWKELVVLVAHVLKFQPKGTIIIDSGSDFQQFAEIEYLNRTKMEKIYPEYNWTEVWSMCNAVIDDIKFSGFDVIITARVKEEYVNDKPTGKHVPRIYDPLKYKADFIVQFTYAKPHKPEIVKNGYFRGTVPIEPNDSIWTIQNKLITAASREENNQITSNHN